MLYFSNTLYLSLFQFIDDAILLVVWGFGFNETIFIQMIWIFLSISCTCQISSGVLFLWCPYFWYSKFLKGAGTYCFTFLRQYPIFQFLRNYGFVKCQNECLYLYFFTNLSNGWPLAILRLFYFLWDNCLFLITPFEVLSFYFD